MMLVAKSRIRLLLALTIAVCFSAGVAKASVAVHPQALKACESHGELRLRAHGRCPKGTRAITLDRRGARGAPGHTGATGTPTQTVMLYGPASASPVLVDHGDQEVSVASIKIPSGQHYVTVHGEMTDTTQSIGITGGCGASAGPSDGLYGLSPQILGSGPTTSLPYEVVGSVNGPATLIVQCQNGNGDPFTATAQVSVSSLGS